MKESIKKIEKYGAKIDDLMNLQDLECDNIRFELRKYWQEKRLSLRKMAERLDISFPYLSDIELGRRTISANLLEKLKTIQL